jgi:hypothetical protein
VLRDCKITPAYGACQERNTTGCILNNDGLGAGVADSFSTRQIHRGFTKVTERLEPGREGQSLTCRSPFLCLGSRANVGAKGSGVNSVFLVQLRKMLATDLSRIGGDQEHFQGMALSRVEAWVRFAEECSGESFGVADERVVHSGCTGNAERQRSMVGGPWSEIRMAAPEAASSADFTRRC